MTEEDIEDGDDVEKYDQWPNSTASATCFSTIILEKFTIYKKQRFKIF